MRPKFELPAGWNNSPRQLPHKCRSRNGPCPRHSTYQVDIVLTHSKGSSLTLPIVLTPPCSLFRGRLPSDGA